MTTPSLADRAKIGLLTLSERQVVQVVTGVDPYPAADPHRPRRLRKPPGWKRLPLAGPLAAEFAGAVFVFVGFDAWSWLKDAQGRNDPALCLPPGEDADTFDWTGLRGRDVLVVQAGASHDDWVNSLVRLVATTTEPRSLIVAAESCNWTQNDGYLFDMPMVRLQ